MRLVLCRGQNIVSACAQASGNRALGRYAIGLVGALLLWAAPCVGNPEMLPPAMKYGARDCAFCHASASGGTGHNERGLWLIAERERRGVDAVDAAWLAARETVVSRSPPAPLAGVEPAELPPLKPLPEDRRRPFDYTTAHGDWPAYAGDLGARKYAPLADIDAKSVARLRIAWVWDAFDNHRAKQRRKTPDRFMATPLMVGGRLFVRTSYSAVAALDAITGEPLWTYDPGTGDGPRPPQFAFSSRGLAYHRGESGENGENGKSGDRVLLVTTDGWLIALAADTGKPLRRFGQDGKVDLTKGLRRPIARDASTWNYAPGICGDVVVVGNQTIDNSHQRDNWRENVPLGDVRGFDVRSGRQVWTFKTVPQEGEFGNDTWGEESWRWMGNTNVWSMTSCDPELGHVYLPVTAPTSHFYGGLRPGDNLFGTSLVAVEAATGKRVWHFQTVRHDIWDYDLPAAPVVVDLMQNGKPVQAVAQVSKVGFVYVFDRVTGKPLWPIEDRQVPASDLEGEKASPTQPFPTWPPPFEMQGVTEDDIIDFTPALRERALKRLAKIRLGPLFLPPSEQGSLVLPGWGGGANWGGAAFDPEERRLYVPSRRMPLLLTARRIDPKRRGYPYVVRPGTVRVDGLHIVKPPWASITAYQLDSGDIAWRVANGAGPRHRREFRDLNLPDLGEPDLVPGPLATRHFLFMGHRGSGAAGSTLRALDKATGQLVWQHRLPGFHDVAPPMGYMAGGKPFVVIATGAPGQPAQLTAFRLP